jgi:hypothetical protein
MYSLFAKRSGIYMVLKHSSIKYSKEKNDLISYVGTHKAPQIFRA